MSNVKDSALTENTAPLYTDITRMVDDPGGTPLSQKIYMSNLLTQFPPAGLLQNGKLNVTVSANDLIVAIKTNAGTDPTTSNPVRVNIGGTVRTISAATSITLADATNWFGSGGSMFATIQQEYFAYAVWDSNSSIVAVSIARSPRFRLVSDASSTNTNFFYLGNYANFTTTDEVCVIGRFPATLSASAAFTWTVPTFTNANLIHEPVFETSILTYAPTLTGFSSQPTANYYRYIVKRDTVKFITRSTTAGTSNATTFTVPLPVTARTVSDAQWHTAITYEDNGASSTTSGRLLIVSADTAAAARTNWVSGAWTGSSTKRIVTMDWLEYEY